MPVGSPPRARRRTPVVLVAAVAALAVAQASGAGPVLAGSSITVSPNPPLEGDVARFDVVLRNTGDEPAPGAQIRIEWPLMGFFIDAPGLEDARIDHQARTLETALDLPAGAERRFAVRVLAPRDSGGDTLALALHVAHYGSGTEHWDRGSVTIDTRLGTDGVLVGRYRITAAGLAVLGLLAAGLVAWLILKILQRGAPGGSVSLHPGPMARLGPAAAVAALVIPVGFWLVFAAMARRDYRALTSWAETSCTILGGRIDAQTSLTSGPARRGSSTASSTSYEPVLALRYEASGREILSTGYDTGSSLRIGGRQRREAELTRWIVGARVPCWFDPADPTDVVVRRGFGGAYLFGLFPVPVFLFGCALVRRLTGRGRPPASGRPAS